MLYALRVVSQLPGCKSEGGRANLTDESNMIQNYLYKYASCAKSIFYCPVGKIAKKTV